MLFHAIHMSKPMHKCNECNLACLLMHAIIPELHEKACDYCIAECELDLEYRCKAK